MDRLLLIVVLIFLVYFPGNIDGNECYNCLSSCPDPFNKTNAIVLESPFTWCIKFKALKAHDSVVIRSFAPYGLCTENKCKSSNHNDIKGIICCCNSQLCNNSNTTTISLSCFMGLIIISAMNLILNE
ncbi:unnamed protein product [Rotaria sordida]|uniref:Protein quiver n=2 Tax=Rotaria sordida TaxID=392033 RepID=A0A813YIW1_9BILA|nr:unnamed protein product [Rotaria sordida]